MRGPAASAHAPFWKCAPNDVPFIVEHGQTIGRLVYEHMAERPERLYGEGIGSNYQGQALKLSKHFRAPA